jgi:hypothetical protein
MNEQTKYKGALKDIPADIVEVMLLRQVEQGNKRDVSVFEKHRTQGLGGGGFAWAETPEGNDVWCAALINQNFAPFYEFHKKSQPWIERVMMVSDFKITDRNKGEQRVVFMKKRGQYLAWECGRTIKDVELYTGTRAWQYAAEIPQKTVLTLQEIADKFGLSVDNIEIVKE